MYTSIYPFVNSIRILSLLTYLYIFLFIYLIIHSLIHLLLILFIFYSLFFELIHTLNCFCILVAMAETKEILRKEFLTTKNRRSPPNEKVTNNYYSR